MATASLVIKNNRYYAVVTFKENGKSKQKWISLNMPSKNNKRRAQEMLEEIKRNFEEPACSDSQQESFVDYTREWLDKKRGFVEMSTWEGYNIYATKHIIPYFEKLNLPIADLKPQHIQAYYEYKYTNGRLDGKPGGLSIPSLIKHSIVLKEVLNSAVMDGIISRNVATGVKLPGKNTPSTERTFLTASAAQEVIAAFQGHILQPLVTVALFYGLRRSEVLGLRWRSIDFENGTITINHTVVKNVTIVSKDKTKTAGSMHTYKMLDSVRAVLLEQKEKVQRNKQLYGNEYYHSDYVFTWDDGKLFRPDYVTRSFEKRLAEKGLKPMRFHDLRHSTASILYDNGWGMKDIQTWMRHSSIEVTSEIYTHISDERKALIADSVEDAFSKKDIPPEGT